MPRTKALNIYKLAEIIRVSKDNNLVLVIFEKRLLILKDFNDNKELLIINLILSLN